MKYPLLIGEAVSVSSFVRARVQQLLDEKRVVVWYDPERCFASIARDFQAPGCVVVDGSGSVLLARRQADSALEAMNRAGDKGDQGGQGHTLLVYWPALRPRQPEEMLQDPFAGFAALGASFGDQEGERLDSLARQAMPDRVQEVERLFREGRPSLDLLDSLESGQTWPLLQQALGTVAAQEVASRLLAEPKTAAALEAVPGAEGELERLLAGAFGFRRQPGGEEGLRAWFACYVLLSEFRFDLPQPFPAALEHLQTAPEQHREAIYRLCDRLRDATATREPYVEVARSLEERLRLPALCSGMERLGLRDTFPFEERAYLGRLQELVEAGDLAGARQVEVARRASVWRQFHEERGLLWKLAERCLDFLESAAAAPVPAGGVAGRIAAYVDAAGGARVDTCYRRLEQSAAEVGDFPGVERLVDLCRRTYLDVASRHQEGFLHAVAREGWPPEGLLRQTQVFDLFIEAELRQGRRVALVLADALRFEMGRDLADRLGRRGKVRVEAAAASLPTTTPCGMASLMPGADATLRLEIDKDKLSPQVGGRRVSTSAERMDLLRSRYGDRMSEWTAARFLDRKFSTLSQELQNRDLVVVRSGELDTVGEKLTSHQARRWMTESLLDLERVGDRLARCGFHRVVLAADHGFVLLSELPAGDTLALPPGDWAVRWRRSALGSAAGSAPGVLVLETAGLGLRTSQPDMALATGFRAFQGGSAYFHEGLSLQEAIVPVVLFEPEAGSEEAGLEPQLTLSYRSDSFTSRVIGLKLENRSLMPGDLRVRLEVRLCLEKGKVGPVVGEAADCDARDPATGILTLAQGVVTPVPVRLFDDFQGERIEIRAYEAVEPGALLHSLQLKNRMLD